MRFFFEQNANIGDIVQLDESEQHHLLDVYRCQPGLEVELFNAQGNQYLAKVVSCKGHKALLEILDQTYRAVRPTIEFILAQSLIKSQHWDLLLEKAMELGLDTILCMITQHLAVGKQTAGNMERWRRIMVSSAKQCGRNSLIQISPPKSYKDILQQTREIPLRLLAHKDSNFPSLRKVLESQTILPKQILIMVGPEGGFSEQEIQQAQEVGIQPFTMGGYTLRAETAAWSILSSLNFYFQEYRNNSTESSAGLVKN